MRVSRWLSQNPLVPGALALLAGLSGTWPGILAAACLLASLFLHFCSNRRAPDSKIDAFASIRLLLMALGLLVLGFARRDLLDQPVGFDAPTRGQFIRGEGIVGRVFTPPPGAEMTAWFLFEAQTGGKDIRFKVDLPEGEIPPLPGARVRVGGVFCPPDKPRNPWEWDEAKRFSEQNLAGTLQAGREAIALISPPAWWEPMAWGERCRRRIAGDFATFIPDSDQRAVVLGIAIGMREGMGDDALLAFRRTGSLHLFAVSGMHVAMLVSIFWLILEPLPFPRRRLVWIVLPLVLAYAIITGWEAPAVRATVMIAIFLLGLAFDRSPRVLNSLAASFIVLILWEPSQRLDLGFQLTYSVVLAIVLFGVPLAKKLSFLGQPDPFLPAELVTQAQRHRWRVVKVTVGSLCFGLAANLGALPLSIHHFNLATPSGILLGLALVPLSWLILAISLAMAPLAVTGPAWAAGGLGLAAGKLAAACIALCTWAADLPGAWLLPRHAPSTPAEILVFDLDRGGSSMLARTSRRAWLVDTGNPGHAKKIVAPAALHLGVSPADALFITHADAQHRGGRGDLDRLLLPARIVHEQPRIGFSVADDGMSLEVLFPPKDWAADRADDRAAVLSWASQGWKVVWAGDAGFTAQKWLLENQEAGRLCADVLCVGWHHTDIGLLREFVDAVDPKLVIWHQWRVETLNPPGQALRDYLRTKKIPLLEQSKTGAITLAIEPGRLVASPFLPGSPPAILEAGSHPPATEATQPAANGRD